MTLSSVVMGEVEEGVGPQHSPSTRRPSPASVQQVLDLVHLQKQTTHNKRHNDKLVSSRSLAPLPAIGRKGDVLTCDSPRDTDRRTTSLPYKSKKPVGPSKSFPPEHEDLREGYFDLHRQETSTLIYRETPAQRQSVYSMRREGTNYRLPPLSELQKAKEREIKAYELSQERAKAQKRSANIEYYSDDPPPPRPVTRAESRLDRPRTSRGRRKMPSPESMEDYGTQNGDLNETRVEIDSIKYKSSDEMLSSPRQSRPQRHETRADVESMRYDVSEEMMSSPRQSRPQRPKSGRGRRRQPVIGHGDYGDNCRPHAPSPPMGLGFCSDDEELNEELRAINAR